MFFQNLCLLGIISGLFERNGGRRVCLSWLTSRRFSTSRNASFSPRSRPNSGRLSALDQQFCEVMALTDLGRFTRRYAWYGNGCPPHQHTWLAHAFITKSVYQFPTTSADH